MEEIAQTTMSRLSHLESSSSTAEMNQQVRVFCPLVRVSVVVVAYLVVDGGLELDAGLDDIDGGQGAVGDCTSEGSGNSEASIKGSTCRGNSGLFLDSSHDMCE